MATIAEKARKAATCAGVDGGCRTRSWNVDVDVDVDRALHRGMWADGRVHRCERVDWLARVGRSVAGLQV